MEKKLVIIISLIIFGAIELTISGLTIIFVIPEMIRLDTLLDTNFFNRDFAYIYFSVSIVIGIIQIAWGILEHRKKHHISQVLLYSGIGFSITMLFSLYYLLILPLERMVLFSQ